MKQFFEYILKFIPIVIITILIYFLFVSENSQISEGIKLSLSALLGGIASYVFIQYSNFLQKIDTKKSMHIKALSGLEIKLNDQLNWLSDIIFHLSNHELLIKKVLCKEIPFAFDASSYRDPINIEKEIHNINNINYKNQLLSLNTGYKKTLTDLTSMHTAYKFMLDQAISNNEYMDSYNAGLQHHLENIKLILAFSKNSVSKTRDALSTCRVLLRDSKNMLTNISRYLIIHSDPPDFDALVVKERKALDKEIDTIKKHSHKEINEIKNKLKE